MTEPTPGNAAAAERRPRRRGAAPASEPPARQSRYRHLVNPFEPLKVFSDDQIANIHASALALLENQGMRVLLPEARETYRRGGAAVDESSFTVRFDRALIEQLLALAPREIVLRAAKPEFDMPVWGRHVMFAPTSGPPNIMDSEQGKRAGTFEDFRNLLKICQNFEVIHGLGGLVEPQDIPVHLRHLETTRAMLLMSDKIPKFYARGPGQTVDNFEMLRIAYGLSVEEFRSRPCVTTIINTNSPLQLDIPMANGIMDYAEAGQVLIITPFTLAGAMAPVTIAGALTLAHAEALAGLALAQMVRPGAPIIYGSFTSNVDMKSGSPAFGTPEYVKASFGAGQLARHIGLPWRSSNATASNCADAQSAYESQMSLWGALLGGCNYMLHAAGWLEGGLTTSYEKFILDIEMLQMFAEVFQPVGADRDDIALEAIAEVGAGGHFFGCAHTMARYRTAFYAPLVSDWQNFGQWQASGAKTATERAAQIWRQSVDAYQPPPRDPAVVEALNDFVARRTAEGGAPPVS